MGAWSPLATPRARRRQQQDMDYWPRLPRTSNVDSYELVIELYDAYVVLYDFRRMLQTKRHEVLQLTPAATYHMCSVYSCAGLHRGKICLRTNRVPGLHGNTLRTCVHSSPRLLRTACIAPNIVRALCV
jgi:hypothetical protein